MAPKKQTRRAPTTYCSYTVEIVDWSMPYSFSTALGIDAGREPYSEYPSLRIEGRLLSPEKHAGKDLRVYIIGDRDLTRILNSPERFSGHQPRIVGSLTIRGEQRDYLGSLPYDSFPQLATLLQGGSYRFLALHGTTLYRGKSDIISLRFEKMIDPEDY